MIGNGTSLRLSRRAILRAAGGSVGVLGAGAGSTRATSDDHHHHQQADRDCSETSIRPDMIHYDDSIATACSDEHPATDRLRSDVDTALRTRYPTVGTLIETGFVPYFDFLTARRAGGWSHWLNPAFIGDDQVMDPDRPESILVDHRWWRPIGVMFIATRDGEPIESPPAVYETDEDEACVPWHAHVGLPGRYAWWKYRQFHADEPADEQFGLPCRTPWMMHVWTYPHPEGVYAHGAPPQENRGGPPAEPAGFETDAVPGEDELGPAVLPDAVSHWIERGEKRQRASIGPSPHG